MVSAHESQAEWTVSRCFRLLRPIVSRKLAPGSEIPQESQRINARACVAPSIVHRVRFGDSPNPKLDPDWMVKPRKNASRQYVRPANSSSTSSDPVVERYAGLLSIPTPVVARVREVEGVGGEDLVVSPVVQSNGRDIFSERFISQSDELTFRSQKIVQGTLSLIEATNSCHSATSQKQFFPSAGPKSLRAMCCRRYARHIVSLEHEQETQNTEEKFDIATEAYTLVEETFDVGGNDYLRAVTREHAIALFERMLAESRIPRSHALALVRRMRNPQRSSLKHASVAEVDSISTALLSVLTPDKPCCNRDNTFGHTLNSLAELSSHCDRQGRTGFEFRRLTDLVGSTIPLCWFGSRRLTAIWTNAFRAFVDPSLATTDQMSEIRDVSDFLSSFVAVDCGSGTTTEAVRRLMNSSAIPDYYGNVFGCPKCPKMPERTRFMNAPSSQQPHPPSSSHLGRSRLDASLNNSFASFFAILASFVIAKKLEPAQLPSIEPQAILRVLGSLSMDVLLTLSSMDCLGSAAPLERSTSILGATLLVLVTTKMHGEHTVLNIKMNDLVQALERLDRHARTRTESRESALESLPDLIVSTVRSSSKLLKNDGFQIILHIADAFMSEDLASHSTSASRLFLAELAISSVQLYAERMESTEAAGLASRLQQKVFGQNYYTSHSHTTPFKSAPRSNADREGLRWEDTICEWVKRTPIVGNQIQRTNVRGLTAAQKRAVKRTYSEYMTAVHPTTSENDELNRGRVLADVVEEDLDFEQSQDTGLSALLMSPATLASSSPISYSETHNQQQDTRCQSESESIRDSRKRAGKSTKRRQPLATITNLSSTRGTSVSTALKPAQRNKRTRDFSDSESSDDELALPSKRVCHRSNALGTSLIDGISDEGTEDSESDEGRSTFPARQTTRMSSTTARRNTRGKALRSLSTVQIKIYDRRKVGMETLEESEEERDCYDELSF